MFTTIGIILCVIHGFDAQNIASSNLDKVSSFNYSKDIQDVPNIITRKQWGAKPPNGPVSNLSKQPPPYVVIHHSATEGCTTQVICQAKVRSFQEYHMNHNNWSDIGYNFLVGEDGNVYEGRGWSKRGAHAPLYNAESIGICFIGDFSNREPNSPATNTLKNLISYGVTLNEIKSDYHLIGHRQASSTTCPGNKLFDLIKTWPHWMQNPSP